MKDAPDLDGVDDLGDLGDLGAALATAAPAIPGLKAVALIGSRARGEAHALSDWDFGVLGETPEAAFEVRLKLVDTLHTDHIDIVDLERAGGVMRIRAAEDAKLLWEDRAGRFDDFRIEAALFWCDMGAIIERAQEDYLRLVSGNSK